MTEWENALMHNDLEAIRACYDKLLDDNRKLEDGTTRLGRLLYNKTIEATELSDKLEEIRILCATEYHGVNTAFVLAADILEVLGE